MAILFDMDGTLFDTNTVLAPALDATFSELRAAGLWQGATPFDTYTKIMGVPLPVVWQTLCPAHTTAQHLASNTLFQQHLHEMIKTQGALYPGVRDTLATLAKHHALYIVSNGNAPYLDKIVAHFELTPYIAAIYSIDRVASGDKGELMRLLLTEQGITEASVVGDRRSDIEGALANGLTAYAAGYGYGSQEEWAGAQAVLSDFPSLKKHVMLL